MKRLLVPAICGCIGAAAHAQSSVTLYGLIDNGVSYVSNQRTASGAGHSNVFASQGNIVGNRWGLTGSEDLGGGLQAIFKLENGFTGTNGGLQQGGRLFGRQAWVGMSSSYGALTLGRQYDSVVDYLAPRSVAQSFVGGLEFMHPMDNDNFGDFFRLDNAVKFASPDIHGLKFGGLYAFSNKAGDFADNRAFSAGATYNHGPFTVSAAYMRIDNPGDGAAGALDGSSTSGDATFHAARQQVWGVGGAYVIGPATLGLVWSHSHYDNTTAVYRGSTLAPAATRSPTDLGFDNFEANIRYLINPAWVVAASYTFTDGPYSNASLHAKPRWNQFNLMTSYSLSKRTDVYLMAEYQHVTGAAGTIFSGAFIGGSGGPSSTNRQFLTSAGLRVKF
ncbi:putative porin [Paraburkholderia terricola]|uniref:porin n=1 Tax=Paraburkholderia terricola TaxID=169427 RepID=UPI00285C2230|nr:porin [Paraburkholderia terricola]MDR6491295.1 putative porin [Paraburkholderia terricola]